MYSLEKELETNVALRLKDTADSDSFLVFGRGLLHLTVLIETMRREGFELMIGCPKVGGVNWAGAKPGEQECVCVGSAVCGLRGRPKFICWTWGGRG
eukprot:scaffold4714_cov73-Isochrysis_galbana.AAC.1